MARILVVEDNVISMKLAKSLLEAEGHEVLAAADANKGLELIQVSPPDLILMDMGLPGMNGLELTRKLREDARTRHILIVALTASVMKGDEDKFVIGGCDGYIPKPIDTRKFPSQIMGFLGASEKGKGEASR